MNGYEGRSFGDEGGGGVQQNALGQMKSECSLYKTLNAREDVVLHAFEGVSNGDILVECVRIFNYIGR